MHGLYFREIRVHEVRQQDLAPQVTARVSQLDMCHAVDGAFLDYGKSCVGVVNIRAE